MSKSFFEGLDHGFVEKCKQVIAKCADDGYTLRPFYGMRDPWDQAKLWRQSRSTEEIARTVKKLERDGAPWLAGVLASVGPTHGRWATNALPGFSWHNHGLALDCYVMENGRACWSARHPGYLKYAENARALGLESGFYWSRMDAVHIQADASSVADKFKGRYSDLDKIMSVRFKPKGE